MRRPESGQLPVEDSQARISIDLTTPVALDWELVDMKKTEALLQKEFHV